MIWRIALLEDAPEYIDIICRITEAYMKERNISYEIHTYTSVKELMRDLQKGKEDDVYFTSESCDSIYAIASFYENELKRDAGEMTLDSLAAAFGETQFLSAQIFSALGRAMLVDEHITLMKFDFDEKMIHINQQKDMKWHSYHIEDV